MMILWMDGQISGGWVPEFLRMRVGVGMRVPLRDPRAHRGTQGIDKPGQPLVKVGPQRKGRGCSWCVWSWQCLALPVICRSTLYQQRYPSDASTTREGFSPSSTV